MSVLFDATDEYVRSVLHRAREHGEITLDDLESILESELEGKTSISIDDIADTVDALADMGIEIDDDLTQDQKDAEFHEALKQWTDEGNPLPSLTDDGWAMLLRAQARERAPLDPRKPSPAEDAAQAREILSKRTFIQNTFADVAPRVRRR
jgi:hypothetical protein